MNNSKLQILNGSEGLIIKELLNDYKNILFVIDDAQQLNEISSLIKFFNPEIKLLKFPSYDTKPFDRVSPSLNIINQRIKTLVDLASENKNPNVIVINLNAIFDKLPPVKIIKQNSFEIKVNDKIDRNYLIKYLTECGFIRLINATYPGEFAVRGSIIDVVLNEGDIGYRIDFFGEKIESIKVFNVESQSSIKQVNSVQFLPSSEIIYSESIKKYFEKNIYDEYGIKANQVIEIVSEGRKFAGIENLLPFFYEKPTTIFDYLEENSHIVLPENFSGSAKNYFKIIEQRFDERIKFAKKDGNNFLIASIKERYLSLKNCINNLVNYTQNEYSIFLNDDNSYKRVPNFYIESKVLQKSALEMFKSYANEQINKKILILCLSDGGLERIKHLLSDQDIISDEIKDFSEIENIPHGIVGLSICALQHGFIKNDLIVFSEQDILGEKNFIKRGNSKNPQKAFREFASISPGELVVHIEHGIGKFEGIENLKVTNKVRDFIKLLYADGDKLYVPVENFELISRYGSGEFAALDKLGAAQWQLRKSKLKNRIKLAAEQLLKIAAERKLIKSDPIQVDKESYNEFKSYFPYVETYDQQKAIDEVIEDLDSDKPMDRLVCGDVGYGKTEVALRAAFVTVASGVGNQVAILVPTTLLSRQHYKTFSERFSKFPITIKQLSKFTARSEIKNIKKDLEDGKVDIIIGTHALLAKDIKFKNLGLIIIDEEQHFGVAQKERLKELKAHCDILTLSATPIPRTLQMSLNGIKDLSIIATAPVDRMPIKTYVMPFDGLTVREAILREFYRGGRIFYVSPRVSYLDSIVARLEEIIPEVKIVKAHGQMKAQELDNIMNDFYDGKYHVLVSTTIVESGLDIPFANTIIVDRAHMFGLSQLYQIRGRIGRSNIQAFAYLTYPEQLKLSAISEKRLSILQSIDSMGAGFSIASHDMDLRGYGNLVGSEQSGHIKEVGIELYQQMLETAINSLKSESLENESHDWSPVLNIGISVQIPEDYISESSLRLSLYRRIAALTDEKELNDLASEMVDRFGKLPIEVEHLITIVKLKQLAKIANIEKIDLGNKGVVISFKNNLPSFTDCVQQFIKSNTFEVKLKSDQRLLVLRIWDNDVNALKGIEKLLKSLIVLNDIKGY